MDNGSHFVFREIKPRRVLLLPFYIQFHLWSSSIFILPPSVPPTFLCFHFPFPEMSQGCFRPCAPSAVPTATPHLGFYTWFVAAQVPTQLPQLVVAARNTFFPPFPSATFTNWNPGCCFCLNSSDQLQRAVGRHKGPRRCRIISERTMEPVSTDYFQET